MVTERSRAAQPSASRTTFPERKNGLVLARAGNELIHRSASRAENVSRKADWGLRLAGACRVLACHPPRRNREHANVIGDYHWNRL